MLYRDEEVLMVRKIAVLQTSLVFVSIALFLSLGFIYVYVGTH